MNTISLKRIDKSKTIKSTEDSLNFDEIDRKNMMNKADKMSNKKAQKHIKRMLRIFNDF